MMVSTQMMQVKKMDYSNASNGCFIFQKVSWTIWWINYYNGSISNHGNINDVVIITHCSMERALKVDKNIERVAVYNGIFCAICGGIFCVVYGGILCVVGG
eukprot:26178_1